MKRYKLGFRNRSAHEQINICERAVAGITRTPGERLTPINLPEVSDAVTAARASHLRIQSLKSELQAETSRRKELLRIAREQVSRACGMVALNLAFHPGKMVAAGLKLEAPKRPIGKPDAPGNLRAEPLDHEGTVRLRYERPVRRCTFEVQFQAETAGQNEWQRYAHCVRQSCVVQGLQPGEKYRFRVRAFNAHGDGPWSDPANARVK